MELPCPLCRTLSLPGSGGSFSLCLPGCDASWQQPCPPAYLPLSQIWCQSEMWWRCVAFRRPGCQWKHSPQYQTLKTWFRATCLLGLEPDTPISFPLFHPDFISQLAHKSAKGACKRQAALSSDTELIISLKKMIQFPWSAGALRSKSLLCSSCVWKCSVWRLVPCSPACSSPQPVPCLLWVVVKGFISGSPENQLARDWFSQGENFGN